MGFMSARARGLLCKAGEWIEARELSIITILSVVFFIGLVLSIGGCAVGRTPSGDFVVGGKIGSFPETAGELANTAAGFLPAPWNAIAGAAVGLLGIGGPAAAAHYRAKNKGERTGWDEAEAQRAEEQRTRLLAMADPRVASVAVGGGVGLRGSGDSPVSSVSGGNGGLSVSPGVSQ